MKTSIIDASLADLIEVNELLRISKAYWGYDDSFMHDFMREAAIDAVFIQENPVKILRIDEKIVGFYSFIYDAEETLELEYFFLHPSYMGQGLGRKLWQACCETAKERGHDEFIIWADPHAEDFYLKLGCKKIGMGSHLSHLSIPLLLYRLK